MSRTVGFLLPINITPSFIWYDTWSLRLQEEHRLKMFGTKVLRKTFQLKAEETGKWRKTA